MAGCSPPAACRSRVGARDARASSAAWRSRGTPWSGRWKGPAPSRGSLTRIVTRSGGRSPVAATGQNRRGSPCPPRVAVRAIRADSNARGRETRQACSMRIARPRCRPPRSSHAARSARRPRSDRSLPRLLGRGPQLPAPSLEGRERPTHGGHASLRRLSRPLRPIGLSRERPRHACRPLLLACGQLGGARLLAGEAASLSRLARGSGLGRIGGVLLPRPVEEEPGRDRTSREDRESRVGVLVGQASGLEIGAQTSIGDRGQERAPDSPVERGRHRRAGLPQRLTRAAHERLERAPIPLRGRAEVAPAELGATEPVDRVDERAELPRPRGRGAVERPGDRARASEPRDLPRLGGLPALRELRGERIPSADEVAGRHRA